MTRPHAAAAAVLASRVAYGLALTAAPERLAASWIGAPASSKAGQVPLRGLGMREAVLHGAVLIALMRDEPLRRWFIVSIAGDLSDVIATVVARREVPPRSAALTIAVGGGAAAISAAVAHGLER